VEREREGREREGRKGGKKEERHREKRGISMDGNPLIGVRGGRKAHARRDRWMVEGRAAVQELEVAIVGAIGALLFTCNQGTWKGLRPRQGARGAGRLMCWRRRMYSARCSWRRSVNVLEKKNVLNREIANLILFRERFSLTVTRP